MTISPLASKQKLKSGMKAAVYHPAEAYLEILSPPADVQLNENLDGEFDWIQIFVEDQAGLREIIPKATTALGKEGLLWVSFPKKTSKIQTDLTRDKGWDPLAKADLKWVTLVSVDDTRSAFCLRPYKPGEEHQSWR
jgi:hypothetical protein